MSIASSRFFRSRAAQESRLKPRLGITAEAETSRPFTGKCRAAILLAPFHARANQA